MLGVTAAVLALVTGYVRHNIGDADQFANRATSALQSGAVRELVARKLTDELVLRRAPDAQAVRPLIQSVVGAMVASPSFASLFRRAAADTHRAVIAGDEDTVTLTVADAGVLAAEALRHLAPDTARRLDNPDGVSLVVQRLNGAADALARAAARVAVLAWVFLALALLGLGGAIALARDRRAAVSQVGAGLALGALLLVAVLLVGRAVAIGSVADGDAAAAARGLWDAFLGDLLTAALVLAGAGAIVAAAAAALIPSLTPRSTLVGLGRTLLRTPRHPALRGLRAAAAICLGCFLVLEPGAAISLATVLVGLALAYAGLERLLVMINGPPTERVRAEMPAERAEAPRARRRWPRVAAGAVVTAGLLALAAVLFAGVEERTVDPPALRACNGAAALCDRPLAGVAIAATHNSMSAPGPNWFATQQDAGIAAQLDDGIHGLLIDAYAGDEVSGGRVRTDAETAPLVKNARRDGVSETSIAAAKRLRGRLGFRGSGRRDLWLCHGFCELGATALDKGLADIESFVVTHPHEVLVVVVEDYIPSRDFIARAERTGLAAYAYEGLIDDKQPTLRRLIQTDQRVIFLERLRARAVVSPGLHEEPAGHTVRVRPAEPADRPQAAARQL